MEARFGFTHDRTGGTEEGFPLVAGQDLPGELHSVALFQKAGHVVAQDAGQIAAHLQGKEEFLGGLLAGRDLERRFKVVADNIRHLNRKGVGFDLPVGRLELLEAADGDFQRGAAGDGRGLGRLA